MNKIEKLNQLGELLKSGAISQDEFESLKSQILNDEKASLNNPIQETKTLTQQNINKDKISLKSFNYEGGSLVKAPDIQYLNLKDLSDSEIKILKPFLRKKQIHSPAEMTSDEILITNKIFSALEIAKMNSERPGFNYAFMSIVSVLSAGAALYFFTISPCFIIIGAGGGVLSSIVVAGTILNKVDATKLDRTFSYIAIALSVIAIYVYFK
tara:strand:+ start:731 stop:1363 length:633 start_codon:yes stop_codon:yes gene_type:complete